MEVFLYNSTVCRLCGEENDSGTLLYAEDENNESLCDIINTYLPIKVSDDGELPRTICPGCTIQVEATVEFLNLIINGQKIIRQLHQRERDYKKNILKTAAADDTITEKIIYEINTDEGVFQLEHPISLKVAGLERPKKKRGRPPKVPKTPEELAAEAAAIEKELQAKKKQEEEVVPGKRRRQAPTRFTEVVQGKELERIFKEEGMTDGEESDGEATKEKVEPKPGSKEPEVIGHLETSGEPVVVVKGKGRGRPKGRMIPTREECAICGMQFSSVGRYMSHVAAHGPARYGCAQCGAAFPQLLALRRHHEETKHQGQRVLACDDEQNISQNASSPIQETEETDVDNPDGVPIDPLDLGVKSDPESTPVNTNDFINSLVNKNNEGKASESGSNDNEAAPLKSDDSLVEIGPKGKVKLKCNHCEKTFNSKQSKSLHIKAIHLGERPYHCLECGVQFAYPRSLSLHKLSHRRGKHRAPPKRFACDLCGKVLNHPSSVVYHKQAEHAGHSYVCNKCGKRFKHRQLLQRHQLVHSDDRPYRCKSCDASFKTKANLVNHQLLHSGVKKFSCDICKHQFAHKTSLTLHMRWHTGSKPFACGVCGKTFSQKGNLSEHARIHTGEKPYVCQQCGRRFTTSSQYRLHTRRHQHQQDRTYACAHCPKRFSSRSAWAAHQKREAGARPHQCGECGRAFLERWALLKHCRRHTGERPFRCPHCPRAFADCSNLKRHTEQVHKQVSLLVNEKQDDQIIITEVPDDLPMEDETVDSTQLVSEDLEDQDLEQEDQDQSQETTMEYSNMTNIMQIAEEEDENERVIYVAYDMDGEQTAYQILDSDEVQSVDDKMVSLYEDGSMLQQPQLLQLTEPLSPQHIAVTDAAGNPISLTMADGTQLALTATDGTLLLAGDSNLSLHTVQQQDSEAEDGMTESQVLNFENGNEDIEEASPVTHFYTIV